MEISENAGKDTEEDGKKSYDAWSESRDHEFLIMMNHNLSKLYHQKTKNIQIILLVTYIISWR